MNARNALLALALSGCTLAPAAAIPDIPSGPPPGVDPPGSPLRVTVFSDFGCAQCGSMLRDLNALAPAYEGRVVVVPRDLITEGINPGAYHTALAARCAAEQGKAEAFSQAAFAFTGDWFNLPPESITAWATTAQLDLAKLDACRVRQETRDALAADLADAKLLRVTKTPTVFVGSSRIDTPPTTQEGWRELLDSTLFVTTRGQWANPPVLVSSPPVSEPPSLRNSSALPSTPVSSPSSPAPSPEPGG